MLTSFLVLVVDVLVDEADATEALVKADIAEGDIVVLTAAADVAGGGFFLFAGSAAAATLLAAVIAFLIAFFA